MSLGEGWYGPGEGWYEFMSQERADGWYGSSIFKASMSQERASEWARRVLV
jgi:hypothetical protein